MKVVYSRSGGIGGPMMDQHIELDTDDLSENEAKELKELVAQASLDKHQGVSPPRPDAFNYRITVTENEQTQTSVTSDIDMPEVLSPLVDWLSERATRKR